MWDVGEVAQKYSVASGTFLVVACIALGMDVIEWASLQEEQKYVKKNPAAVSSAPVQQRAAPVEALL